MEVNIEFNTTEVDVDNSNLKKTDINIPTTEIDVDSPKTEEIGIDAPKTEVSQDYNDAKNKPSINGVELIGDKTTEELGIENYDDTELRQEITDLENNKANKDEIPDVSNFITNTANDLLNYYLKSETYTKQEVLDLLKTINGFNVLVVNELPTENIDTHTIYFVPKEEEKENDVYDEYIYIGDINEPYDETNWEHIGNTSIDLFQYVKFTDSASSSKPGVIKTGNFGVSITTSAYLTADVLSYTGYQNKSSNYFISKGTLENVLANFTPPVSASNIHIPDTFLTVNVNRNTGEKEIRVNFQGTSNQLKELAKTGRVKLYLYKYTRSGLKTWEQENNGKYYQKARTGVKKWTHPAPFPTGSCSEQCWGLMSFQYNSINDIEELIANADYVVGKNDCGYVKSEITLTEPDINRGYYIIKLNDIMSAIVRVANTGAEDLQLPVEGDGNKLHMIGARKRPNRAREMLPIKYVIVIEPEITENSSIYQRTKYIQIGNCINTARLELFTYRATKDNSMGHGYDTRYSFLSDIGYSVRTIK